MRSIDSGRGALAVSQFPRPAAALVPVLFAAAFASRAPAAMWLDPNWALIGEVRPEVVYDTNLVARTDNLEDVYASITPRLQLERRNSATHFEVAAQVQRTWFQDFDEFDSTDPLAELIYEYPAGPDDEPRTHLDLHWSRNRSANPDLGRRVRSENLRGRLDQRLWDTGRTVFDLRLNGRSTDYREADLNTNDAYAVELRAGYGLGARTRLGLGYGHEWTQSRGVRGDTDGDEDRVFLRLDGDLGPTWRGTIETGAAWVDYTGAVERDDTAWIAAVSLTWQPGTLSSATLRAARYTDFSPEGVTALRSEILLDLRRELGSTGFVLMGGAGVSRVRTFFADFVNEADAVSLHAAIAYQLTERFAAELSERYTRQSDDRPGFDYERHVVTGQLRFLF